MKKLNSKLTAIFAMIAAVSSGTAYAIIPLGQPQSIGAVNDLNRELTLSVTKRVGKYTVNSVKAIVDNTNAINRAIGVATTQESLVPAQIAQADKNAKLIATNARKASKIAEKIIETQLDYGGKTGQGYAACKVKTENANLSKGVESAINDTGNKVVGTDMQPGFLAPDAATATKMRENHHAADFCTQEEVDAKVGGCTTVSVMAGADTNATVLFESSLGNSKVAQAKKAVRQNILGTPYLAVPKSAAKGVTAQAYLYNVNRATSLSAFPNYSLAHLESMSEIRPDLLDAKGKPQSANDMIFNTVSRYYGSPEAKEWNKSMLEQRPRGLLVEMAKMEGVGSWMDYQEYLTNQRLEGNLAAMTLTTALPMEEDLDRMYKKIARTRIQNRINTATAN